MLRLPDPCLVVLVGAAGAGKSTWAVEQLGARRVIAADDLRAMVGLHEHDQRASKDAFDVLERIVRARLRRRFTTVVDTTGLDPKRRARFVALAREHRIPAHAVIFAVDDRTVRARNRQRPRPVPSSVLTSQLRAMAALDPTLAGEGFDGVHGPDQVELVPARYHLAPEGARRQREDPVPLTFGLQIGGFDWPGGPAELAPRLAVVARAAEDVGFTTVSVMDHLIQIPQVGPEWQDIPESWTTLGYLAASTRTASIGTLVTNVALRPVPLLAKMAATLDVLSGGRTFVGLGAGWFDRELQLYGYGREPAGARLDRLEHALVELRRWWGPGEPTCYPRPLQERLPVLVGGDGERRTLRLVAEHADACNLQGEPDHVARKVAVLRAHCEDVGRDPATVRITHLAEAGVSANGADRTDDADGTVEELIGRFRALAEVGVQHCVVGLHHRGTAADIDAFAPVVEAFRASP